MSKATLYNEKELLVRVARGDEKAFRTLYDHYRKQIYAFSLHLTESAPIADEMVQDVFMKVWLYREKLTTVEYFSTWLHAIAKNGVFDALKRIARETAAKKEMSFNILPFNNSVEEKLQQKENEKLLQDAIGRLSAQQQIIYNLSKLQGLRNEEIAAQLNISPNTVKVHLVNARKIIREYVRSHCGYSITLAILLNDWF